MDCLRVSENASSGIARCDGREDIVVVVVNEFREAMRCHASEGQIRLVVLVIDYFLDELLDDDGWVCRLDTPGYFVRLGDGLPRLALFRLLQTVEMERQLVEQVCMAEEEAKVAIRAGGLLRESAARGPGQGKDLAGRRPCPLCLGEGAG